MGAGGRPAQGLSRRQPQVHAPRREAEGELGARPDPGQAPSAGRGKELAPDQAPRRRGAAGERAQHRRGAPGERRDREEHGGDRRGGRSRLAFEWRGRGSPSGALRRGRAGRAARPPGEVHPASACHRRRPGAGGRGVAARAEVRRLPHPRPSRGRAGAAHEPERARLDGEVSRRRRGRGAPARLRGDAGRRGGRLPARRHDQLPGAPERGVWRRPGWSAHLRGLRPPPSGRVGRDRRPPRGQEGAARAPLESLPGPRAAQVQRSRGRRRPRVLRPGVHARPRGHRLEAARRALSRRPDTGLAQDQVRPRAGGRDRRLYRPRGLAHRPRRPAGRGARRRATGLRGQGRHGVLRQDAAGVAQAAPRARTGRLSLHAVPHRSRTAALGEARAGRPGDVRRVDGRRSDAASLVPGAPRGQAGGGGRARDADTRQELAATAREAARGPREAAREAVRGRQRWRTRRCGGRGGGRAAHPCEPRRLSRARQDEARSRPVLRVDRRSDLAPPGGPPDIPRALSGGRGQGVLLSEACPASACPRPFAA